MTVTVSRAERFSNYPGMRLDDQADLQANDFISAHLILYYFHGTMYRITDNRANRLSGCNDDQ